MKELERLRLEKKAKYKPKKVKADGTINPRRLLTDLIQSIYLDNGYTNKEIPWEMETAVIKNLMDNYKDYDEEPYSEIGIKSCLEYMKEIEKVNFFGDSSNTILALVPFSYDDNKKFRRRFNRIKKMVERFDFDYTPNIIERDLSISRSHKENNEINMNTILD
jgi:hypothetical protein